ncbi:uncharacterized protein LOC129719972 [Wyeomyia smithii]|uniref:uncharacterized protein LOC129719972 n=1 Tax=Wyeomyia smithii TaxID=174621 RepID=UPI0024681F72|nr:uncharacterized protein LOC129719972 [Wyeomyia smithii]
MALESNGDRPLKEEQLDAKEPTVIAKIHFPEFDPDDIETWFILIVALGSRAKYVHSVIAKCNATNTNDKYDVLKAAAIAHFRPSESQRLTSLLSGMTLGDQKPSVLLSEMRRLGGVGCTDSVLTNLWLRALPHTTCSIIAAMPAATLDEQAKVADKILEAPREQISAVRVAEPSSILSLEQRIEALSRRLDEALSCVRGRDRHNSRTRDRSFDRREGTPARSKTPRRWICWFHYKHGAEARKCEKTKSDNPNVKCIVFDGRVEVYTRPKES